MEFFAGNCSQQSKQSQNSFDWSELDDALDLDRPPTFNSTISPLEFTSYSSQLILTRNSQRNNSTKADSGFDIESNPSTFYSQASHVSFEGQKRNANQHSSPTSSPRRAVVRSDVDSGCSFSPIACSLPSKKSRQESPVPRPSSTQTTFRSPLRPSTLNRLRNNSNEVVSSQRQTADTSNQRDSCENTNGATTHQHSTPNPNGSPSNPIHLKIAPILNLMSQIKTQYSDCAFVYALAAHMCRDIYPRDCHISLKTALLLSIVSCTVMRRKFSRNNFFIHSPISSFVHSFYDLFIFMKIPFRDKMTSNLFR